MSNSDPREVIRLSEQINLLLAGNRIGDSWAALQDCLSAIVAFSADDQPHAHTLIDLIHRDMSATVDKHWDHYRAQRSEFVDRPSAHA